jgi:nitrogen-specific signal transduction histidine kinase
MVKWGRVPGKPSRAACSSRCEIRDPASLEHLFNAFYTTKSGGMGLAICRSIIEAHEGQLCVTANEPRGAVFQFTLPLQRDETLPAEHAGPIPAV